VILIRRSRTLALTIFFVAVFSAFAWSDDKQPRSFHVDVVGRGRPMILIPGLSSSPDTWTMTVARYRDRYECHVLTLAGFVGQPPIAEPLMAAVRRDLAEYVRDKHLDHPVIIGHSLGGTLAMEIAIDHPELVGPVVVVDMVPFLGGAVMQAKSADEAKPAIAAMRGGMNAMTAEQWEQYARPGQSVKYMVTGDANLKTLIQWSLASDRHTVTDVLADIYGLDLRDDVSKIQAPVLALGTWRGVHDQVMDSAKFDITQAMVNQSFADQFAKLPRLHFALSENARHFIMFDDPRWFFAELDAFLRDPDAAVRVRGFDSK
jgi:pimeloyl-ACP methyl ester carboxylesterase